MKYILWIMVIVVVSGINLSSMCKHDTPINLDLNAKVAARGESIISKSISEETAKELTWKMLTDVEFKDVYLEELDAYYWKPTFGQSIKDLEGDEVFITGYIIPVDYDENFYVLSRYPFANCFFCGGAGPESVIDLRFANENRKYKTDERLTFKGKFKLNADDVYQMNYILLEAIEQ